MSQSTEVRRFPISPAVFEEAERLGDPRAARLHGITLRVVMYGDTPWFLARDIAMALAIVNPSHATSRLDDDEHKTDKLSVVTGDPSDHLRKVGLVSESGLYSMIMTSRVPAAHAFRRWVTHEVLPAIRKTGAYVEPAQPKTRVELARELLAAEERAEQLAADVARQAQALGDARYALAEAEPKIEAFDALMSTDGSVSLAVAAQMVGLGRGSLIERLARWGAIIMRPGHSDHLRPYQSHIRAGRFVVVAQTVEITHRDGTGETLVKGTTRVTAKGVEWIRSAMKVPPTLARVAR